MASVNEPLTALTFVYRGRAKELISLRDIKEQIALVREEFSVPRNYSVKLIREKREGNQVYQSEIASGTWPVICRLADPPIVHVQTVSTQPIEIKDEDTSSDYDKPSTTISPRLGVRNSNGGSRKKPVAPIGRAASKNEPNGTPRGSVATLSKITPGSRWDIGAANPITAGHPNPIKCSECRERGHKCFNIVGKSVACMECRTARWTCSLVSRE